MDIPKHILERFRPSPKPCEVEQRVPVVFSPPVDPSTLTPVKNGTRLDYSPIGCDPDRKTVKVSKTGKKDKGNFVVVNYRKTSREFAEKVKRSKFECFTNADWSIR